MKLKTRTDMDAKPNERSVDDFAQFLVKDKRLDHTGDWLLEDAFMTFFGHEAPTRREFFVFWLAVAKLLHTLREMVRLEEVDAQVTPVEQVPHVAQAEQVPSAAPVPARKRLLGVGHELDLFPPCAAKRRREKAKACPQCGRAHTHSFDKELDDWIPF
jgi:hypothetical protein